MSSTIQRGYERCDVLLVAPLRFQSTFSNFNEDRALIQDAGIARRFAPPFAAQAVLTGRFAVMVQKKVNFAGRRTLGNAVALTGACACIHRHP